MIWDRGLWGVVMLPQILFGPTDAYGLWIKV